MVLRGGFIKPSGAGKRTIITHFGNETGFLEPQEETMLVFEGKKDLQDYHTEMNLLHYQEWFGTIVKHLPQKSVVVIDRAPYHTAQDPETKNPTNSWRKGDIIEWLKKNKIAPLDEHGHKTPYESLFKRDLIDLAKPCFKAHKYIIDNVIQESGKDIKLVWTPVGHCELNAIELVWAWVKRRVATLNTTFKVKEVVQLVKKILQDVPQELWKNSVEHVKGVEKEYWEKDKLIEVQVIITQHDN
jgi:hypothetical protein